MFEGLAAWLALHQAVMALAAVPGVERVRPPLTTCFGPDDVALALDVAFADTLTTQQVEAAIVRVQTAVRAEHSEFKRIFIEAKPLTNSAQSHLIS